MLSCAGKRSHRHTILHVSFSNSFGLASARPTPQGLSGAPNKQIAIFDLAKFQSHLYGIESDILRFAARSLGVSIAPLWNWKYIVPRTHVDRHKVSIAPLWNWKMVESPTLPCPTMFQSHLYGIESQLSREKGWKEERFNRTFMELKGCCASAHRRAWPFQSHLYGIERPLTEWESQNAWVSIAPLWNWKLGMAWSRATASRFQSHLYGIESQYEVQALAHLKVSIAPLWNWKYAIWVGNYSAKGHGGVSSLK